MPRKSAAGSGTIRKKTVTRDGKPYTYWEARYTEGYDPGTGKQIQRSITGKTQKEVSQKLKAATAAIDDGTYSAPSKMTVAQWLDIWSAEYLGGVKPSTAENYRDLIRVHITPGLGAVKLDALAPHMIQKFYNSLHTPTADRGALSPKYIKNIHGVLHSALNQALLNGYIRFNPSEACTLPRGQKREISPLDDPQISAFLKAIRGHRFELLYTFTLFTGMREGEVLGLMWDCVDMNTGVIVINKQLQMIRCTRGEYQIVETKNSRSRSITVAPFVLDLLRRVRVRQLEWRLLAGDAWEDSGFVFTDEAGRHLRTRTVYNNFKKIMADLGTPSVRFHDLRHSYAVAAIRSGDDIKTVQGNLGHATAAFTLDVYGHVTNQMKQASADRMQQYIESVKDA